MMDLASLGAQCDLVLSLPISQGCAGLSAIPGRGFGIPYESSWKSPPSAQLVQVIVVTKGKMGIILESFGTSLEQNVGIREFWLFFPSKGSAGMMDLASLGAQCDLVLSLPISQGCAGLSAIPGRGFGIPYESSWKSPPSAQLVQVIVVTKGKMGIILESFGTSLEQNVGIREFWLFFPSKGSAGMMDLASLGAQCDLVLSLPISQGCAGLSASLGRGFGIPDG
ncbi:hypothetical protein HGM15179_014968 [Zosterops borbonicus]|uniref:Uncharacterized protein n=1 Tax=Zosterops borbonicus TaxID=364589 RepID=A0A8K1LFK3_9PASS|nr:hypothetical protein HGM15179_014968 [Zosterops borbonicus]